MTGLSLQFRWRGRTYKSAARGLDAFAAQFNQDFRALTPVVQTELRKFGEAIVLAMRQRHSTPWPQGTSPAGVSPGTMSRRSSGIASTLQVNTRGNALDELEMVITGSRITAVHERGATIRAKRAQYLTVPLPAALTAQGLPIRRRARDWPDTFVKRSKAGNLIIFQKRDGGLVPLYVLRKQVVIPPRLGLEDTAQIAVPIFEQEVIEAMLRDVQREAGLR